MVGIYKITSPSNKIYIGQSWNIQERFKVYNRLSCKSQVKLYNSLLKYSVEKHKFEIIHKLPDDIEQEILNDYEVLYCNLYKDCGVEVLNIRECGSKGQLSEETKKKISNSLFGKTHTKERRKNMSIAKKGRKLSQKAKDIFLLNRTKLDFTYRKKQVIDKKTGVIYSSAKEASEIFGCTHGKMIKILGGFLINNTSLQYLNKDISKRKIIKIV